jgi:branched-chain amino acid aminotransferase
MFFEDHCDRLADSLRKVGADADYDRAWLSGAIGALFEANGLAGGNVKIWVAAGRHGESRDWFLNANRSFYPPASFYSSGVRAEIMAYTRDDPNVKRVVAGYREKVQSVLESRGVFELLLRDGAGYLTEGSRTNLLFVIGDKLFTAPDGMILKGIVRKQIFAAAKMAGVETVMRPICAETVMRPIGAEAAMRPAGADMPDGAASAANAANAASAGGIADLAGADAIGAGDGIFITGTSIGALPVSHVGDRPFGSAGNPVIRKLSDAYAEIAESYVSARKRA